MSGQRWYDVAYEINVEPTGFVVDVEEEFEIYEPSDENSITIIPNIAKPIVKTRESGWYAQYKVVGRYHVTLDNIQCFDSKPQGNWWGPFHCSRCADWCANYGKLENQAWNIVHGTADESYYETMGYC